MKNKLPSINNQTKICIICEGNEEYEYLERLKLLGVWNEKYDISLENAGGNGNVPARYQDKYQNGSYDLVLMFCDTDRKPYEQYVDIKRKIDDFHGVEGAADAVLMYGNPCTMQIVVQHWKEACLKSSAKKVNAPLIEECTGVANYKAKKGQLDSLYAKVTRDNYADMLERVKRLPDDDTVVGSSNFARFVEGLGSGDDAWIDGINEVLEG